MTFKEYIEKFKLSDNSLITFYCYETLKDLNGIEEYPDIETLHLSSNLIKDLEPLKYLSKLNFIMLSYNLIEDLEPLYYLDNLKYLWINGNPITNNNILYSKFNHSFGVSGENLKELKNIIRFERRKKIINLLDQ